MSGHQRATLEDTVYFWFAANDTSGSGGDGATPLFDVREAGAAAGAIPLLSGTPTLLSHANFPAGCHEIAVAATDGNGFAAGDTFAVFCTIAIDSQNPSGFVGSCTLSPVPANLTEYLGVAVTGTLITAVEVGQVYKSAITTVTSQTEFVMTTGFSVDDAWNGCEVILVDDSSGLFFPGNIWISDTIQDGNILHINTAFPVTVTTSDSLLIRAGQHPRFTADAYDGPTRSELTSDTNSILANETDANVTKVKGITVTGSGTTADPWGP